MIRTGSRVVVLALLTVVLGCSTTSEVDNTDQESLLSAAGFQRKPADTPDQLSHLATLQQRALFSTVKDGRRVYVYADAEGCVCLFVGSEANYQTYERIIVGQLENSGQHGAAAADVEMSSMRWGLWGSWARPIY